MERKEDHSGHRQRLISKLERGDLCDHEILEVLLFYVFKRRNTNDLAHRLLAKFGNLKNLFSASVEMLEEVEGIGRQAAVFLYALGRCNEMTQLQKQRIEVSVLENYDAEKFFEYIRHQYEDLTKEVLDFYLLDKRGNICFRRRFQGEESSVAVAPDDFTQMLLEVEPSGLIAVHNHPSGALKPSAKDEEMTRMCQLICSFHNVLFCDHIIVGKTGMYSYYRTGEMEKLSRQFSVQTVKKGQAAGKVYLDEVRQDFPNVFKKNLDSFTIEERDGGFVGIIKDDE